MFSNITRKIENLGIFFYRQPFYFEIAVFLEADFNKIFRFIDY